MKGEKKLSKAHQAYLDDVEEALLLLARLKQRADYRAYFEENWKKNKGRALPAGRRGE